MVSEELRDTFAPVFPDIPTDWRPVVAIVTSTCSKTEMPEFQTNQEFRTVKQINSIARINSSISDFVLE